MLLKSLIVSAILVAAVYTPKGCTDRGITADMNALGEECYNRCQEEGQVFTGIVDMTLDLKTNDAISVTCTCDIPEEASDGIETKSEEDQL